MTIPCVFFLGAPRELTTRNRVLEVYSRLPEDFPSAKAYNDYLEEIEDIGREKWPTIEIFRGFRS
jgi:hypothetical protein